MDRKEFFQALTGLAFVPTLGGLWAPPKELASGVVSEVIPIDDGMMTMKAQIWRGPQLLMDTGHINVRCPYFWTAEHNSLAEMPILSNDGFTYSLQSLHLLPTVVRRERT